MNIEVVKKGITDLINDFRINYNQYKQELEANTETKLVEPLFNLLGWTKNDFVKRETTRRGKNLGFADYAFKIDGRTVFFLEVKRVGIPLEKEADKQVISYALSKRIPFAISTNFEELKIFCVEQENATSQVFRVFKKPDDYITNIQNLLLLSKESFEKNLILKEAENEGRLKRRMSIDKILLDDLMHVRKLIADDIEKTYPKKYEVNDKEEIVQRIIDRLIFIRRCEDVGMNPEDVSLEEIKHLPDNKAYPKLKEIFEKYNDTYNSGLFAVGKDNDCDIIKIEGLIIKKLIGYLYESKDGQYIYNFDWIDADVLGQVYEQYLGKILEQTKSGKARLKDGQAHRKEQGIYYTPAYIVDYIVKNTLGELLKDKKINAEDIKILDPACGSGSFLIKAFDYLYGNLSSKDNTKQHKIDSQGMYSVKTEILKRNIYGVDLDNKAVEITKLNLLLKAAEKGRKLPEEVDLHIKHGNSLIDDENIDKNAFKWAGDFKEGSFDVIIGNPPYLFGENITCKEKEFYHSNYAVAKNQYDSYWLFIEKSLKLLRKGGFFSFIVPDALLARDETETIRKTLLEAGLTVIAHVGTVFEDVGVSAVVFIVEKNKKVEKLKIFNDKLLLKNVVSIKEILKDEKQKLIINVKPEEMPLLKKIKDNKTLLPFIKISRGEEIGKKDLKFENQKDMCLIVAGEDITPYGFVKPKRYLNKKDIEKNEKLYTAPKIVIPKTGSKIIASIDQRGYYTLQSVYNLHADNNLLRVILALLNSKVVNYFIQKTITSYKKIFPQITQSQISNLPMPEISDFIKEKLTSLVDKMLSLNKRLNEIGNKNTSETAKLKEEIKKTDDDINEEVYKLYGITKEEQKIIEESLK